MNTPICDFVRDYAARAPLRLHMPGHKGVGPLGVEALDVTEIPGADVLYRPSGVIAESEANAAAQFGSGRTVYSTEGSSLCIRAMLYLARLWARERGMAPRILAARNAHKALLSAAALLDLPVDWLFPAEGGVLSCAVDPGALDGRLADGQYAAVYVTSPDYLGNCADLAALAAVCRARGALLLVDNAHGAYLRFLTPSRHPMDLGADLCCDSAHKTLDVLTGGAYLHLAASAPPTLRDAADRAMSLFASTSPSYLILQSLDRMNAALADGYAETVLSTASRVAALRRTLTAEGWTCVGDEPLKLTLCPKSRGYTGAELAALLERRNIFCEFADPDHVVFMFAPSLPARCCGTLLDGLRAAAPREPIPEEPPALSAPRRVLTPREAMLAPAETMPVDRAAGRVLASPGVSCPPAVPILLCGEVIDEAAIRAFRYYGIERVDVVKEVCAWKS